MQLQVTQKSGASVIAIQLRIKVKELKAAWRVQSINNQKKTAAAVNFLKFRYFLYFLLFSENINCIDHKINMCRVIFLSLLLVLFNIITEHRILEQVEDHIVLWLQSLLFVFC